MFKSFAFSPLLGACAVALLAAGGPAAAAGMAEVSYIQADKFSDAGRTPSDREEVQKSLTAWLQKLALDLPDKETLKVEVLDIDLAGEIRPGRVHDIRVLRGGADWPRIKLRWTLTGPGVAATSGEAQLSDMAYLQGVSAGEAHNDNFYFEKRLLQKWFKETFVAH
jgi:hypothetical protein